MRPPSDPSPEPPPTEQRGQPSGAEEPGSLLARVVLGVACLVLGGLGYQLVIASLHPPPGPALPELPPGSAAGNREPVSAPKAALSLNRSGGRKLAAAGPSSPARNALVSLQCLAGGQSERADPADPSNYGPRLATDWQGRPVRHTPSLIVLHETVVDEGTALALFRRTHSDDGQQASYHVLIGRDGRRIRVVPDAERAFGAGDSEFEGMAVQLKPGLRPSVNNIALHVSLVSPPDGADGERRSHSGYTPEQYRSLASQIAQWQALYNIRPSFVVTHQEVDRSGSRRDPRSFDWASLSEDWRSRWLACGGSTQTADLGRAAEPTRPR